MKLDIILSGVGGQGILSIAYLVDAAAMARGLNLKQAEVHGMSQRGGAVYSHLRLGSDPIHSDLIPEGSADLILSMEPVEVWRYTSYLNNKGWVVSNSVPFVNVPNYPSEESIQKALFRLPRLVLVDAKRIATKAGAPQAQNVALLGVASPFMPFEPSDVVPVIHQLFERKGEKVVKANLQALDFGSRLGRFVKELLAHGATSEQAFRLSSRFDPATIDPALAPAFAEALLKKPVEALQALRSEGDDWVCGDATLRRLGV